MVKPFYIHSLFSRNSTFCGIRFSHYWGICGGTLELMVVTLFINWVQLLALRVATFGAHFCKVLKLGHFGKQIRSTWKVLKCGAGGGWWRPVVPIMWKMKKYYIESMREEYPTYNKQKANWIGHILDRNCLLKHIIEGNIEGGIEVMGRLGRRYNQLLDDFKEVRRYWKLKEEALDHTVQRTCSGRDYWPVIKQTTKWMSDWVVYCIYVILVGS